MADGGWSRLKGGVEDESWGWIGEEFATSEGGGGGVQSSSRFSIGMHNFLMVLLLGLRTSSTGCSSTKAF